MNEVKFLKIINRYLELYKTGQIHGEFLIIFIQNLLWKNREYLNTAMQNKFDDLLAVNELYESDPGIREAEPWLTGDERLAEEVLKIQEFISGKKQEKFPIPKSISEEKNRKKVLFNYIECFKNKDIDEEDLLYFLWIFLNGRYMSMNYLIKEINNREASKRLEESQKIKEEKALTELTSEDKRNIIEIFLSIQAYL